MAKTKKQPEPVKILASGKVSIKMSATVLQEFIEWIESEVNLGIPANRLYRVQASEGWKLEKAILTELFWSKFRGGVCVRAITLTPSQSIAILYAWKNNRLMRCSNLSLDVVLMKLDQKLG
jgi:hypothetical protein